MRALSIRQPFAEMILQGLKTIEFRSRPTRIIGERFYIYAAKKKLSVVSCQLLAGGKAWSRDLAMAAGADAPPPWIAELANGLRLFPHLLPTGVIVGSAVIEKVVEVGSRQTAVGSECGGASSLTTDNSQLTTYYEWHLAGVRRAGRCRKPSGHPQPVWFEPF